MKWNKVKFEDLYLEPSKNGFYKESKTSLGTEYKIVNMGEIFAYDFISSQKMKKIILTDSEFNRFSLKENDLLFARRSLVESGAGKVSFISNLKEQMIFESSIIRVRLDEDKCYPLFYFYWLRSLSGRRQINAIVTGINVKGIRGSDLKNILVDYPDYEYQKKIANILKKYDDLIENNKKQIKLLEKAAEKLYKEWFIKLNYPNHENEEIIDGIPPEWHKGILNDITEFNRGKIITKDSAITGRIPVIAGGLEPAYYHNTSNTNKPVITISGSGANAGYTKLHFEKIWASDCSFVDISNCKYLYFVYCFLRKSKAYIDNLKKGAAQPHVYPKDINNLEILIPSETILNNFTEIITPYFDKIGILQKQILLLQKARDKLLPKLMNGSIEI